MLQSLCFVVKNANLFCYLQCEALALLLIGISINQLKSLPEGTTAMGLPVVAGAYICTLIFVSSNLIFWYMIIFPWWIKIE